MTDLWSEASRDLEAETADKNFTAARVTASQWWPFLSAATSQTEYESRKAMVAERLASVVPDAEVRKRVLASWDEDYAAVSPKRADLIPEEDRVSGGGPTYEVRLAKDWDGEWTPAGDDYEGAESVAKSLYDRLESKTLVLLRNNWNGAVNVLQVSPFGVSNMGTYEQFYGRRSSSRGVKRATRKTSDFLSEWTVRRNGSEYDKDYRSGASEGVGGVWWEPGVGWSWELSTDLELIGANGLDTAEAAKAACDAAWRNRRILATRRRATRRTAATEGYDVSVCVDCLFYAANGDLPEDDPTFLERYRRGTEGGYLSLGSGEGHFSWSSCDICGSPLGGDRFDATLFVTSRRATRRKQASEAWYVHTNSVRPDGDTDSHFTQSFDSAEDAYAYADDILDDEWNGPTNIMIQGPDGYMVQLASKRATRKPYSGGR